MEKEHEKTWKISMTKQNINVIFAYVFVPTLFSITEK